MLASTPAFDQTTRLWLSLRPEDLRSAVEEPDQRESIELPATKKGLTVRLYLKGIVKGRRALYILVVTKELQGERETIYDAWYVPRYLAPDNPTPMGVLASLCQHFGLRIRIAGLTDRLIYSQTITPKAGEHTSLDLQVLDKPTGKVKATSFVKPNDDGSVDVALVCAIDVFALKRKLAG
jgi:hypothetical protein